MEAQVSNIFLSIQNQQKRSPRVVRHPGFLSRTVKPNVIFLAFKLHCIVKTNFKVVSLE